MISGIVRCIDKNFIGGYPINSDDNVICENLIKAAYWDDFEGQDINIIYDEDLKAYIITNAKDFDSITYDENLKLIVVRAADATLLYKYEVN